MVDGCHTTDRALSDPLVNGEHGSCKSTLCRRLRALVDPNSVPLRDIAEE